MVRRFNRRDRPTYADATGLGRSDVICAERSKALGGSYKSRAARTTLRTVQFRTDESLSTYIECAELAIGPPANLLKNLEN